MALVLSSVAISLAATIIYRQHIQIKLSGNLNYIEQAYQYIKGMEDWSIVILEKDFKDDPSFDSLDDTWATELPVIPIEGGSLTGKLNDLQNRININNLLKPRPPRPPQPVATPNNPNPVWPQQPPGIGDITTLRLVKLIEDIDPNEEFGPAENFIEVILDWLDNDSDFDLRTYGAESDYYQSQDKPYFAADGLFSHISELRLLKDFDKKDGFDEEIFINQIKPFISTLPTNLETTEADTPINVNTASKEILLAIGFDETQADNIIKEREENPFETFDAFQQFPDVQSVITNSTQDDTENQTAILENLGVKTIYFQLAGEVSVGDIEISFNSIIHRNDRGEASIIMRELLPAK